MEYINTTVWTDIWFMQLAKKIVNKLGIYEDYSIAHRESPGQMSEHIDAIDTM